MIKGSSTAGRAIAPLFLALAPSFAWATTLDEYEDMERTIFTVGAMREIFDDEHKAFRESFAAFVAKEATPHYLEWEEAGIAPRELYTAAGQYGFLGMAMAVAVLVAANFFPDSLDEIIDMAYKEKVWAILGTIDGANTHIGIRVALKAEIDAGGTLDNSATADSRE